MCVMSVTGSSDVITATSYNQYIRPVKSDNDIHLIMFEPIFAKVVETILINIKLLTQQTIFSGGFLKDSQIPDTFLF